MFIPFAKAHGVGNDFLIVAAKEIAATVPDALWGQLAEKLCDRHCGVGADGLVLLGESVTADAAFRIFNSDGSEAGLSGNALRCAGAWLLSRSEPEAAPGKTMRLATRVGERALHFVKRVQANWILRAEIGAPSLRAADVPFAPPQAPAVPIVDFALPVKNSAVRVTVLSMGNPQCILFVEDFHSTDWLALGAELERHPWFPDRANVGFVRVVSPTRPEARFWERGAGHTLASGTGSCACVVAGHLARQASRQATVVLERGELEVNWREDGMVELTGPTTMVAEGTAQVEMQL